MTFKLNKTKSIYTIYLNEGINAATRYKGIFNYKNYVGIY